MYGLYFLGNPGGSLNNSKQMAKAIATATQPIDYFELTAKEFQSIFNNLDKSKSGDKISYSYKGIAIKVTDE